MPESLTTMTSNSSLSNFCDKTLLTALARLGRPIVGIIVDENILDILVPACVLVKLLARALDGDPDTREMRLRHTDPKLGLKIIFDAREQARDRM